MKRLMVVFFALLCVFAHAEKYQTGLQIPADWHKRAKFASLLGVKTPEVFDWRTQVKVKPQVKNQGSCGSCWAFATSSVLEWQLAIKNKYQQPLSPQELVSCDKSSYGCQGGFFTAFDYEKAPGLTYEKLFPYEGQDSSCEVSELTHDAKIVTWGYVGAQNRAATPEELMAQIYTGGPVAVTVCANNAFMNYRGGIYQGRGNCQNHMVHLVGYNATQRYWIMQNSWGEDWGEQGYMRIRFGASAIAQMAAFAVYKN